MPDLHKTALVTGVSSGIGRAVAKSLIDDGWRVFGSVRKSIDASDAQEALGAAFTPLIFDVTDNDAIKASARQVSDALQGRTLEGLVNNAGIAVAGPLQYLPLEELEKQFDVNVYGPLRVVQAFAPLLGVDPSRQGSPGRIVNISSVAGKMAAPFLGPYAMSKHALEAMSDSLRRELTAHGIDVVTVGPGAIVTPIWAKADEIDVEQYRQTEHYGALKTLRSRMRETGENGLPPEAVGDLVRRILNGDARRTRYAILRNKFALWTLPRMLPKRWVDKLIAKRFDIKQPSKNN